MCMHRREALPQLSERAPHTGGSTQGYEDWPLRPWPSTLRSTKHHTVAERYMLLAPFNGSARARAAERHAKHPTTRPA